MMNIPPINIHQLTFTFHASFTLLHLGHYMWNSRQYSIYAESLDWINLGVAHIVY